MRSSYWRKNNNKVFKHIIFCFSTYLISDGYAQDPTPLAILQTMAPAPLLNRVHEVDWWFIFKFNAKSFPGCGQTIERGRPITKV